MSPTPGWIRREFLQGAGVVWNSHLEFCWEQQKKKPKINSHSRGEIIYSPEALQNNTPKTGGFCLFFRPVCASFQMQILIMFQIGWVQLALPWVSAPPSLQNNVLCHQGWWMRGSNPSPSEQGFAWNIRDKPCAQGSVRYPSVAFCCNHIPDPWFSFYFLRSFRKEKIVAGLFGAAKPGLMDFWDTFPSQENEEGFRVKIQPVL